VQQFEQATNALAEYGGTDKPGPPVRKSFTTYLITFASMNQQVNVTDAVGAAPVTNGIFIAEPTPGWNRKVQGFAAK